MRLLSFSVFSAEAGSRAVMEIPSITAGGLHPLSYRSRLLSVCCVCKSHSADSCRTPGNPECIDCLRKFKEYITSNLCRRSCKLYNPEIYYKIVKKHRGRIECPVFFHFFYFFFLTRIFLINFRISQIITIIRKRSPAQIPTIIPANLFGCFNRSAIFLLSSTTFRPCVVL